MRISRITLLCCYAAILAIVSTAFIAPKNASATIQKPDWLTGEAQHVDGATFDEEEQCSIENITVEGIKHRVYADDSSPNPQYESNLTSTSHNACVYRADGYRYAHYLRYYYAAPASPGFGTFLEFGVSIALDGDSSFKFVNGFGNRNSSDQIYLGRTKSFLQYSINDRGFRFYKDVAQHITTNSDGVLELDDNPDYRYTDDHSNPLEVYGLGVSLNKKWISFGVRNFGIIEFDTDTLQVKRVSDRYDVQGWTWPTPLLVTSVSDDGLYVVAGGMSYQTEVIQTSNCGSSALIESPMSFPPKRLGIEGCPYADLTSLAWNNSQSASIGGQRALDLVQMSASGGSFSYFDLYKWNTIYAPNYLQPGQLYYLALGDSYASGEGDVTLDGADHYMPGTNIYGDYKNGIPRETCHVSLRSYPMRIAEVMQLTKGVDMQSIACSGAVMSDVLSSDKKSTDYVDASYLGQSTQRISDSGSRLAGVSIAAQLQDEAREEYLPGRVQQIELIKKTQPLYATIMMSGNDLGFGDVLTTCATNSLPAGDETCDYAYGDGLKGQAQKIHDIYPKLVEFYKDIREVSPRTTIYVIGYPQFMDTSGVSCPEMLDLYTQTERQSIHDLISYANSVIRNAALDAGVKYIDVSDALVGKQLCGSGTGMTGVTDAFATMIYTEYMKSLTTADSNIAKYVNLLPTGELNKIALQLYVAERAAALLNDYLYSPATVISNVGQELSHPNAIGHEAMFDVIKEGLGDDLLESSVCNQKVVCPSGATLGQPNVENYLPGLSLTGDTVYISGGDNVMVGHETSPGKMTIGALVKSLAGQFVRIAVGAIDGDVDPSQPVTVELHSQQVVLGTMSRVGDIYELETSLSQDIAVGLHMLHVKGTLTDGRLFDIDSPVFVEGPHGDMDDDGIADSVDACAFAEPSGVDKDRDGIDDDCDLNISQSTVESPDVTNRPILEDKINKILLTRTTGMDKYLTSEVFGQDGSAKNGGIDGVGLFSYAAVDDGGQADNPSSAPYWLVAVGLVGIAGLCLTVWLRSRRG